MHAKCKTGIDADIVPMINCKHETKKNTSIPSFRSTSHPGTNNFKNKQHLHKIPSNPSRKVIDPSWPKGSSEGSHNIDDRNDNEDDALEFNDDDNIQDNSNLNEGVEPCENYDSDDVKVQNDNDVEDRDSTVKEQDDDDYDTGDVKLQNDNFNNDRDDAAEEHYDDYDTGDVKLQNDNYNDDREQYDDYYDTGDVNENNGDNVIEERDDENIDTGNKLQNINGDDRDDAVEEQDDDNIDIGDDKHQNNDVDDQGDDYIDIINYNVQNGDNDDFAGSENDDSQVINVEFKYGSYEGNAKTVKGVEDLEEENGDFHDASADKLKKDYHDDQEEAQNKDDALNHEPTETIEIGDISYGSPEDFEKYKTVGNKQPKKFKSPGEENESIIFDPDYDKTDENEAKNVEYKDNCPAECPARRVMVCARCQHNIHRTFLSVCHLRQFHCKHPNEKMELVSRRPCMLSAPYLMDLPLSMAKQPDPGDEDTVLKFLRCKEKGRLKRDPRCKF
ncbi:protein PFC0760c isoform X2 [Bicyclus anynana]|uniref:Protein PFC0760c isoform X2 n=1 Tax=Bicyclus anynana TaxID=110368 RepID=A0ABM3M537_BICAN|nr:protein PFC0760c isoform X2 [Bicyclus anynana]